MSAKLMLTTLLGLGLGTMAASVYTVDAREVAVVTSFGASVKTVTEPGLYVRVPWPIHQVVRFDQRARLLTVPPAEVLTKDKKNLVVEPFVVWRVSDPQLYLEAVANRGGGPEAASKVAEEQISSMVVAAIGDGMGKRDFQQVLGVASAETEILPPSVTQGVAEQASSRLGVTVLEVELRYLGLPLQNEQSIYERMRAERLRIANAERAEGEEQAAMIRAEADRKAAELIAEAEKKAAAIRASAEGNAASLYVDAYREDPGFYMFLRKLEAYDALFDDGTVIVLDSESDLFDALVEPPR